MKKIYIQLLASILLCFGGNVLAQSDLVITGILDGPLTGGTPKTLEIYVINDVADLSIYGIANANNGGASSGVPNFTFPADAATAGEFIYLSSVAPNFLTYFGFEADYITNAALSVNGDDVVELYRNGVVVDYFGEIGVDGSGLAWEYLDGWAYRVNGAGPNTTFTISEWTYSGINVNDNQTTNGTSANPWPIGTYSMESSGVTSLSFSTSALTVSEDEGTITVNVIIVNPGDDVTNVDVVVTGGSAVNGTHFIFDDPTTLTFPAASNASQSFTFTVVDDEVENDDRTILFSLENTTNDAVIGTGSITIAVEDDDTVFELVDIATVSEVNAEGVAVNLGGTYAIQGIVYGVNMRTAGLSFTVIDETGGMGVFSDPGTLGYSVAEGDEVIVAGIVEQFNGLTQLSDLISIEVVTQGNAIADPTVVATLNEDTESEFVMLECVSLTDPSQWNTGATNTFNATVTNGSEEFTLRVVNTTGVSTLEAPVGSFDIIGIGGQFDNSSPFTSGYQIFPRGLQDIVACEAIAPSNDACADAANLSSQLGGPIGIPIPSDVFTNVAATSEGDPNPNSTENCWAGIPLLSHTVWFSFTGDGGNYFIETANCGVSDYIDDGDTQMAVFTGSCDELTQVACNEDHSTNSPINEFPAGLAFQTASGVEYFVMIDGFENSEGQFCMQFTAQTIIGVNNTKAFAFDVFPNPSNDRLFVNAPQAVEAAMLTNILGQKIREFQFSASDRLELDVNGLEGGIYILQLRSGNQFSSSKIVVE